jgi:hypothetical protein
MMRFLVAAFCFCSLVVGGAQADVATPDIIPNQLTLYRTLDVGVTAKGSFTSYTGSVEQVKVKYVISKRVGGHWRFQGSVEDFDATYAAGSTPGANDGDNTTILPTDGGGRYRIRMFAASANGSYSNLRRIWGYITIGDVCEFVSR